MFDNLVNNIKSKLNPVVQTAKNDVNGAISSAAKFFPSVGNYVQKQYNNWKQEESNKLVKTAIKSIFTPRPQNVAEASPTLNTKISDFKMPTTTPQWGADMARNASQDPSKFKRTVGGFIGNQIIQPALDIPKNINIAKDPTKGGLERGIAGLQAVGGAVPGVDDAVVMAFLAAQNKLAGGSFEKGFTGDEFTGTGTLVAPGTKLETPLNLAGLGLPLLMGKIKPRQLDDILNAGKKIDSVEFNGNYKSGDIKKLTDKLDEFLGAKGSGPGRIMAKRQLEDAASRGDETAQFYLTEVNRLEDDIVKAQQAKVNPNAGNPTTQQLDYSVDNVAPKVTTNFYKPKNSNQPDFMAGPEGVSKVTPVGPKKLNEMFTPTKETVQTENPLLLPSGKIPEVKRAEAVVKKVGSVTGVPKSTGRRIWEAFVPQSKKVIENSAPSGKKISQLLEETGNKTVLKVGQQQEALYGVMNKLSKQEKMTFADVTEGVIPPISPAQADAVAVWKSISDDISARSKAAGLDTGYLENYFPHHIVRDMTEQQKNTLTRNFDRRYGNLELARQTDLPYDKDPSVLYDYIENANKRIFNVEAFGKADENIYSLVDEVGREGGDAAQVRKYVDQILGKNQNPDAEATSQVLRSIQSFKLGFTSSLTNLTQNISTLLRTDPVSVGKSIAKYISDPDSAIRNAIKVGQIDAKDGARIFSDTGNASVVGKWLKLVGFSGAEKINRVVAVNAGIEYSNKLIKQAKAGSEAAVRELDRLGFNTKELDKINPIEGGKAVSEATQFSTKVGELPYGWQTPIGRVISQFKGFAYKQTGFIASEVKRVSQEASKGNLKPLINALTTYGVAAPIAGEIINDAKSWITNKDREKTGMARYFENILGATSLGLLDNLEGLSGKYGSSGVVGTALGPTAGDIAKTADTVTSIQSPDQFEKNKAYRNIVKSIPGVGPTLSNTFIPNSYVDNKNIPGTDVNIGVNEGLGEKDKKIYNQLLQQSPEKAAAFKASSQATRDSEKEPGFLSKVFGGKKEIAPLSKTATPAEIAKHNKEFDTMVENGVIPSEQQIKDRYFRNQPKDVKSTSKLYSQVQSITENPDLPQEYKDAVLKASGLKPDDYYYYQASSLDNSERRQILLQQTNREDRSSVITTLLLNKRVLANKSLMTSEDITYLYDQGAISKQEKEILSGINYDESTGKFYLKRSIKDSYAKKGTSAAKKAAKAKATLVKRSLNSVMSIKTPKAPTIDYSTIPKKKTSLSAKDKWFRG